MVTTDLLKDLPASDAEAVLALGTPVALPTGAELFHLGDVAGSIYVVMRGRVRLTLPIEVRGGRALKRADRGLVRAHPSP
jgi:CRP-like cAMP-binding protein